MNTKVTAGDIRKLKKEQLNTVYIHHPITNEEIEVRLKITSEYAFFAEIEIIDDYNEVIAGQINAFIYQNELLPVKTLFGVAKCFQKHQYPNYYFSAIEVHLVKVNDENMDEFITSFMRYVKKYFEE